MSEVRRYTVCPDFLRPMSDQLDAGQYVLASDYDDCLRLLREAQANWDSEALAHLARIASLEAALAERDKPCVCNERYLTAAEYTWKSFDIKFCPYCGHPIAEGADHASQSDAGVES